MKVIYRYFAIKPILAEHPVGSGIIVEYRPGEEVPANEWGRATDNLVEMGKISRVAFNIEDDEEPGTEPVGIAFPKVEDAALHVTRPPRGRPKKRQP